MTTPERRRRRRCCLYRHFDVDGVLLYVGISKDPGGRTFTHSEESQRWVRFADSMTGTWLPDSDLARIAEDTAILNEGPVYNVAGTGKGKRAECEARRQAYERTHVPVPPVVAPVLFRLSRQDAVVAIRRMITNGEILLGEQVKPVMKLRADLNVGHDSMIRAVDDLIEEGWLVKPYRGSRLFATSVLPPVRPDKMPAGQAKPLRSIATEHVTRLIASGAFTPGDQLPSLAKLAETLGLRVGTVQRAMEDLRASGVVTARKGAGTFVADHLRPDDPDRFAHLEAS